MATTTTNLLLKAWNSVSDLFNHTELAANWQRIDDHDHTGSGKGLKIPAGGLAPAAVHNTNLAADAVDGTVVVDNSIGGAKLTDGTVTAAKLSGIAFLPTGLVSPYAGSSAPGGWLLCDGAVVSRTTYAPLFAIVGTTYNTGGEAGTSFRLPDLRGRVPVGVDGAAARLAANDALGQASGTETTTLTAAQSGVPAHNHNYGGDIARVSSNWVGVNVTHGSGAFNNNFPAIFGAGVLTSDSDTNSSTAAAAASGHSNMQPYQIVNYIIKL